VVLPERDLPRIAVEIGPREMMIMADLGAAQTAEQAFRRIGASAVQAVRGLMVDPPGVEPASASTFQPDASSVWTVVARSTRDRMKSMEAASVLKTIVRVLPQRDHHAARARQVLGEPPVQAVLLLVLRPDVAAHMAAIDLDDPAGATDRGAFHLRSHGFADLVYQAKAVLYWMSRSRDSASALLPLTSLTKITIAAR
jgi:hypothetical protein